MLYRVAFDDRIKETLSEILFTWSYNTLTEINEILDDLDEINMIDQYYHDQEAGQ